MISVEAVREWLGLPFVMAGFLIHALGVVVACIGCFIAGGFSDVKEFWTENIN